MASGKEGRRAPAKGPGPGTDLAERSFHGHEFFALILVALGLFLTISALSFRSSDPANPLAAGTRVNWGGSFGWHFGGFFVEVFGLACYPLFAFVVYWGLLLLLRRGLSKPFVRVFGVLALTVVIAVLLSGSELRGAGPRMPFGLGGSLGHLLGPRLYHSFGAIGVALLLLVTGGIAFLVATDWPLYSFAADVRSVVERREEAGPSRVGLFLRRAFEGSARAARKLFGPATVAVEGEEIVEVAVESGGVGAPPLRLRRARREPSLPVAREPEPETPPAPEEAEAEEERSEDTRPEERRAVPRTTARPSVAKPSAGLLPVAIVGTTSVASRATGAGRQGTYSFPPMHLLETADTSEVADPEDLRRSAEAIERRLKSHGVDAKVVCISAGPAVTVFELELAEGLRVSSLPKFAPDLAAALKAFSVRIVAPIPGKHTVGVEVPNEIRSLVRLRELCALREPGRTRETVPLFLGRDVAGKPLIEDLARMPHLLIAGATGSGKSVCINAILLSMLLMKSPEEIRVILIDPKMVELQNFKTIPHLLCPVVTSMKQVPRVLDWAVETMEQRYAILSAAGVRNLRDYNALGDEKLARRLGPAFDPERTPVLMPTIVMVIDEFADLMAVAANDIEVSIQRLAQKSRAVGIHVILATQRPSRDVITGLIKANLPTRIAFQVANRVDSRVVLDSNGADQLLGHGDLLYVPPGTNRLVRAQGAFVSDDEIHAVVTYLEEHSRSQEFEHSLVQVPTGGGRKALERDDLYEEAVRCVLEEQRGSATLLQRKLSVGYTRASRLIEIMCEDGVVGEFVGSKSREVLMTLEDWDVRQAARGEEDAAAAPWVGSVAVAATTTEEEAAEEAAEEAEEDELADPAEDATEDAEADAEAEADPGSEEEEEVDDGELEEGYDEEYYDEPEEEEGEAEGDDAEADGEEAEEEEYDEEDCEEYDEEDEEDEEDDEEDEKE